jgi:hypothetical protein
MEGRIMVLRLQSTSAGFHELSAQASISVPAKAIQA